MLAPNHIPRKALDDGAFVIRASTKFNFKKGTYRLGLEDGGGQLILDGKAVPDVGRLAGGVHLRFSDRAIALDGEHELQYEWNAKTGPMRVFWAAVPECEEGKWLVQFFSGREQASWLHAECRENAPSNNGALASTFMATFGVEVADGSHIGTVWPKHG